MWDVQQGTAEWKNLRLGMPTSSCFTQIITPTGKLAKDAKARKYAYTLVAESVLGYAMNDLDGLQWIERGTMLEPDAVKFYEMDQGAETLPVGFVTNDAGTIGCSPDRLIKGKHAGLEIKCPAPHTHIGYICDGFGSDYVQQVQGQIYIAEFEWVDKFSYHPELPPHRERTYRDEAYITKMAAALDEFVDMKNEMLERVRAKGFFVERERLISETGEDIPGITARMIALAST